MLTHCISKTNGWNVLYYTWSLKVNAASALLLLL